MENQSAPACPKGKMIISRWLFVVIVFSMAMAMASLMQVSRDVRFFDKDHSQVVIFGSPAEAETRRDSLDTQLVGYVKRTYTFGIFRRGEVSATESYRTVIYENKRYFSVGGQPRDFLRSLLDKDKFPLLAKGPFAEKKPLKATNAEEAINEARAIIEKWH